MTTRTPKSRINRPSIAALGVTLLLVSACGSDDEAETTSAPTTAAAAATTAAPVTTPATTSAQAGDFAADPYCAAVLDLEAAAASGGDPSEDPTIFAEAVLEEARPTAALAPASLSSAYAAAIETMESVAATGDPAPMEDLDLTAIHAFDLDTCGWNRTDVTAQDFRFDGIPETLQAGVHDFELTNKGTEFHVLIVVQKKAGVTESFEQLLEDPAGESKVEELGSTAAAPGAPASYVVLDLEPGEYLVMCPIPQGSSGPTEGTGPPHFALGMQQVITVT